MEEKEREKVMRQLSRWWKFLFVIMLAAGGVTGCSIGKQDDSSHLHAYYYDAFDDKQRMIYEVFNRSASDPSSNEMLSFEDGETASIEEVNVVYQGFLYDHPEYYWIGSSFQYERIQNGDGGYDDSMVSAVAVVPIMSADELIDADRTFEEREEWFCEQINAMYENQVNDDSENVTEDVLVRIVHDVLIESVSYEEQATYDVQFVEEHTAYGALVNGSAVCDGYALAFRYLLSLYDIDCVLIPGDYAGAAHVWTTVYFGGSWHEIDPTMNDGKLRYYDLTTGEMERDHQRELYGIALLAPQTSS